MEGESSVVHEGENICEITLESEDFDNMSSVNGKSWIKNEKPKIMENFQKVQEFPTKWSRFSLSSDRRGANGLFQLY